MRQLQLPRFRRSAVVPALVLLGLLAPAAAVADTPPLRLIDVVEVTWDGAPAASATGESVAAVVRSDAIDRWKQLSAGRIVFTFDQVLPRLTTPAPMPCDAAASLAFLSNVAAGAYAKAAITDWGNRYLVVVAPRVTGCLWSGRGVVNPPGSTSGMLILNGTDDAFVLAHELGHNLGLGHSNLETCTDGRADGPWENCSAIEYGSATDLMSNLDRTSPLAVYHQWRLGIIPDSDVVVADRSQSITLHPLDSGTGARAIFVRDASAAYWMEYRRADPANGIHEGLVIYRTDAPPASSVITPLLNSEDQRGIGLTTDVWLISLGDYRYDYPPRGSPSLAAGSSFTTAFGGATVVPRLAPQGTVLVEVKRAAERAPAAPTWTDRSTWSASHAPLTRTDLDTGGMAIERFEARFTTDTASTVTNLPATAYTGGFRSALSPLGTGVAVRVDALPEGTYALELRAITVAGVAGPWSTRKQLSVDHGAPEVSGRFAIASVVPNRSVALRWTGARDPGIGICAARAFRDDGFAMLQWSSATAGVPALGLAASDADSYSAVVEDCFGNAQWGDLQLTAKWRGAAAFARSGTWTSGSTARCARDTCVATLRTGPGSTAIVVAQGSATVMVDGRRVASIRPSSNSAPRIALRVEGAHVVRMTTTNLQLLGAQSLVARWRNTAAPDAATAQADESLSDDDQAALAAFGFTRADFAPSMTVQPITGGTTTSQPTLDLCNASFPSEAERQFRRQVAVVGASANAYLLLSTETVRYWSRQAARRAVVEIDAAAALCKSRGYALTAVGAQEPYTFTRLPMLPMGLRPAADRRIFLVTIGAGDAARTALIAYQFKGAVMSALYVVREGADTLDAATAARWLDVATVLAGRLGKLE